MTSNKSVILTGDFMRPKFSAGWTLWLRFLFKDSGRTWIMDLNATCRVITNLALERKINQYTPENGGELQKKTKYVKPLW